MNEARIEGAMNRIEAALGRIEQAAVAPRAGSEGGWNAYHNLKKKIRGAVGDLDTLIAEIDR